MCTVDWPAFFGVLKDFALAVAAIVAATVAVRGLQTWREELRGKADFDVARGLARATYKVREEMAACRSTITRAAEYPADYKWPDASNPPEAQAEAKGLAHVYNNRWKHVIAALGDFDAQALEAEALWGPEIRQSAEALHKCATVLFTSIEAIIDNARAGGSHFEGDQGREFGRRMRANAHASRNATDNELSNEIAAAVAGLESRIRPHLARPR